MVLSGIRGELNAVKSCWMGSLVTCCRTVWHTHKICKNLVQLNNTVLTNLARISKSGFISIGYE